MFGVGLADDEGSGLAELEFQVLASRGWPTRDVRRVGVPADDTLRIASLELLEPLCLLLWQEDRFHQVDVHVLERTEQIHQSQVTFPIAEPTDLLIVDEQHVKGMEGVAGRLAIEDEIDGTTDSRIDEGLRHWNFQTEPVDTSDGVGLFANEQAAAIQLFGEPPSRIGEEPFGLIFLDRIEQLTMDAGSAIRLIGC